MTRVSGALFLIFLLPSMLLAQEAGEPLAVVGLFLQHREYQEAPEADPLKGVPEEKLREWFEERGFRVVGAQAWAAERAAAGIGGTELLRGAELAEPAAAAGCDFYITGRYGLAGGRFAMELLLYHTLSERLLGSQSLQGLSGLAAYNSIERKVSRLGRYALNFEEERQEEEEKVEAETDVVIEAPDVEGADIVLSQHSSTGTIEGGRLVLSDLPASEGVEMEVTVRKAGFYPETRKIVLGEDEVNLQFGGLRPRSRWGAGFLTTTGQLPGAGAALRRYFLPDWNYIGLEAYPYVQNDWSEPSSWPIPHGDIRLVFGQYLFLGPTFPFRLYLESGAGLVLTRVAALGEPVYSDFYLNLISLAVEWNLKRLSLFLRSDLRIALDLFGTGLMGTGLLISESYLPPLGLGAVWRW